MSGGMLPSYVERGGDLVYRHPHVARGVRNHLFSLPASEQALARLFAQSFVEPSGGAVDIRPDGPEVTLSIVTIDAVNSLEPPHSELSAGAPEMELAFWVAGRDVKRNRPVLFMPYLFVDSGAAVPAGREIFGFAKQHGMFTLEGARPLTRVSLDVLSVPRFDPTVSFSVNRLIDVTRVEPTPDLTNLLETATHGLVDLLSGPRIALVFLKQFRDVAQPERACYQAIVEAEIEVTALRDGGPLGAYSVALHDLASHPIRRDLGLPGGAIEPTAARWSLYDFVLLRGTELWRATSA